MQKNCPSLLMLTLAALTTAQVVAAADANTNVVANDSAASGLAASQQMLLVTTKDWNSVTGTMRRFARKSAQDGWIETAKPISIVVGRNGLGWGRGLALPIASPGPTKHEGDGKSPAGVFRLSSAFGLAEADKVKDIKLPYRQLTDEIECVDDVKSTNYNSIVDRAQKSPPDWDSSEKMRAVGGRYRLGIVVDHNAAPRETGAGSCIFIHIWQDAVTGTSGCTAMAPDNMEMIIRWVDPNAHPLLVQMPEAHYKKLKEKLELP